MGDKVNVVFETNNILDPDLTDDNLLLSGPVNILAAVDNVHNDDGTTSPSLHDMDTTGFTLESWEGIVSLQSPAMDDFIKDQLLLDPHSSIVVYVKDVRNYHNDELSNNQEHRGAYFLFKKFDARGHAIWQEILLGTHSHANPRLLDKFSQLDFNKIDNEEGLLIKAKPDGTFDFEKAPKGLPELPADFIEKLNEANRYANIQEPDDDTHHLDAALNELENTYDWLEKDENGNYINIAAGTCRDLYREIKKLGKKTYLNPDGSTTFERGENSYWIELESFEVNYDTAVKKDNPIINAVDYHSVYNDSVITPEYITRPEDSEEAHLDASLNDLENHNDWENNTNTASGECVDLYNQLINEEIVSTLEQDELLISLPLNSKIYTTDRFIIFDNNQLLKQGDSRLSNGGWYPVAYANETKILTIKVKKSDFNYTDPRKLTILFARDVNSSVNVSDIEDIITDRTLVDANELILRAYLENSISKKPSLPHLYLMTDNKGKITWDNMLLPTQTFYVEQYLVKEEDMVEGSEHFYQENFVIKLKDVLFKQDSDFPLILVGNMFALDATIRTVDGDTLVFIPKVSDLCSYEVTAGITITIIIIKRTPAGSFDALDEEFKKRYITREDAVEILSRGKLNLDNYATKNELKEKYASKFHTHSNYASALHNHDERYANFYHTHPELYLALANLIAGRYDTEDSLSEIEANIANAVSRLNEKVLIQYSTLEVLYRQLNDSKITATPEIVEVVNNLIDDYNEINLDDNIDHLSTTTIHTLTEIISLIAKLLQIGRLTIDNIVLDSDILVENDVGGIKAGKQYIAGTSFKEIITDMLRPHMTKSEVLDILTPVKEFSKIKWFIKNSNDEMEAIDDISKIPTIYSTDDVYNLYFKFEFRNKFNEECSLLSFNTISGQKFREYPKPADVLVGENTAEIEDGYYLYGDSGSTSEDITVSWYGFDEGNPNEYDTVYCNYRDSGEKIRVNPDADTHKFTFGEDFEFGYDKPDVLIGSIGSLNNIYDDISLIPMYFKDGTLKKEVSTSSSKRYITILSEYLLKIIDEYSNTDITDFFEMNNNPTSGYREYTYGVLAPETIIHKLIIEREE